MNSPRRAERVEVILHLIAGGRARLTGDLNALAAALEGRGLLVIPVAGLAFATGGVLIQMQEELIAFVPVLLLLVRQLGFTPVTAVAMSLGAAAVGVSGFLLGDALLTGDVSELKRRADTLVSSVQLEPAS